MLFTLPTLSKTKFVGGLQCHKLLWYQVNASEKIPEPSPEQSALFNRGHLVGKKAQALFPGGREVDWRDFKKGLSLTKDYVSQRIPVFEAGFLSGGTHARADILQPVDANEWDIIEVKSVTAIKEVFIRDIAFQRYCYVSAGLKIRRCVVLLLAHDGDEEKTPVEKLFTPVDVTSRVEGYAREIEVKVAELRKVAGKNACPEIEMGEHCRTPYACLMIPLCSKQSQQGF